MLRLDFLDQRALAGSRCGSVAGRALTRLACVLASFWPATASATGDAGSTAFDAHPLAVHGVVSLPGGPLGLVGAEIGLSPTSRIGTALGAGIGLNSDIDGWRAAPRFAASAGYRVWLAQKGEDAGAAGFWLSGSFGRYDEREFTIEAGVAEQGYEIDRAYWVGIAFVGERRYESGLSLKGSVGIEYLVNSSDGSCYERARGTDEHRVVSCEEVSRFTLSPFFPSAALAVGYAF